DAKTARLSRTVTHGIVAMAYPDLRACPRASSQLERQLRVFQEFTGIAVGARLAVVASRGGIVRLLPLNAAAGSEPTLVNPRPSLLPIRAVALHPEETAAAWVTEGRELHFVRLAGNGPVGPIHTIPLSAPGTAVAFTPGGSSLAAGTNDGG